MTFDHDKFLPPFVKLSTSPRCTYFSSQYNGTHNNDNPQHGACYNSSKRNTLPLPGKSQHTHLSTVNVHNNRPRDSAHFSQPMSRNSTYTSLSLAHVCSNRLADSTCIVSYIRRKCVRTIPNVDIIGSSKWHTRHLATEGVARFNYVLVTNSNPVMTCASDNQVNPYPNIVSVGPPLLVPGSTSTATFVPFPGGSGISASWPHCTLSNPVANAFFQSHESWVMRRSECIL